MKNSVNYTEKSIIITTHVFATGPSHDLKKFLLEQKCKNLLFIGHPLFYDERLKGSGFELYTHTKKIKESFEKIKKIPSLFSYVKDVVQTCYFVISIGKQWDLFVGYDNLNAFSGLILKKLGYVKKTIYYVIDYNPKRFKNPLLNILYHKLDQICVMYCDETWNLSPRMKEGRKKYFGFSGGNQKVVPIGIWYNEINRVSPSEINSHTVGFVGHIIKKQGVQYLLQAIAEITKQIPDFKLIVMGGGEYLPKLKQIAFDLGVSKFVQFMGYVKKHTDIDKILVHCAAAIALYEKYDSDGNLTFTYFADPGKIRLYLGSGLPVILSDVSYNARDIEKNNCGVIINYNPKDIAKSIISLIKNKKQLMIYHQNAAKYAAKYDWNIIFQNNLSRLLR